RLVTYHLTNEATASSNVRKKFYVIRSEPPRHSNVGQNPAGAHRLTTLRERQKQTFEKLHSWWQI
ncbi:MAG: hypothetical protein ABW124_20285, partial [Candidatus Thiodiazotropha sp. 6PLUC9]